MSTEPRRTLPRAKDRQRGTARIRPPAQARSRRSLERMLKAGEMLIAKHGVEGLIIADVVRRAKSSNGAFYARFADKDALIREVQERFLQHIEELMLGALADLDAGDLDIETAAGMITRTIAAVFREHASLIAAFIRGAGRDEVLRRRASKTFLRQASAISDLLGRRFGTPPAVAETFYRFVTATFEHYVGLEERSRWADWETLTRELESAGLAYLMR